MILIAAAIGCCCFYFSHAPPCAQLPAGGDVELLAQPGARVLWHQRQLDLLQDLRQRVPHGAVLVAEAPVAVGLHRHGLALVVGRVAAAVAAKDFRLDRHLLNILMLIVPFLSWPVWFSSVLCCYFRFS